jgi:peptidoglycan L-alanyl-D-glutamate endopeptidase CwlK
MPKYGATSRERQATLHQHLVVLTDAAIGVVDIVILCGARSDKQQALEYLTGRSKLDGVQKRSLHQTDQKNPLSRAVDLAPYYGDEVRRIPWSISPIVAIPGQVSEARAKQNIENLKRWYQFGGLIKGIAAGLGIPIIWGGDWDNDGRSDDQRFHDLPHFQLVG